jgi:hypothetical protein
LSGVKFHDFEKFIDRFRVFELEIVDLLLVGRNFRAAFFGAEEVEARNRVAHFVEIRCL